MNHLVNDVDHRLSNPHWYIDDRSRNSVSTWLSALWISWLGQNSCYHRSRRSSNSSIRFDSIRFIHVDPSFFGSFRVEHQHAELESRDNDWRSSSASVEQCSRRKFDWNMFVVYGILAVRYQRMEALTLSELLNSLDGVVSPEDRIIFMTTNFIGRYEESALPLSHPSIFSSVSIPHWSVLVGWIANKKSVLWPSIMLTRSSSLASLTDIAGFLRQVEQLTENCSKELSVTQPQGFFRHHKESLGAMRDHFGDWARLEFTAKSRWEDEDNNAFSAFFSPREHRMARVRVLECDFHGAEERFATSSTDRWESKRVYEHNQPSSRAAWRRYAKKDENEPLMKDLSFLCWQKRYTPWICLVGFSLGVQYNVR